MKNKTMQTNKVIVNIKRCDHSHGIQLPSYATPLSAGGVTVINSPGTINADYRGEIKIALINLSKEDFTIKRGMRIAQIVISTY